MYVHSTYIVHIIVSIHHIIKRLHRLINDVITSAAACANTLGTECIATNYINKREDCCATVTIRRLHTHTVSTTRSARRSGTLFYHDTSTTSKHW